MSNRVVEDRLLHAIAESSHDLSNIKLLLDIGVDINNTNADNEGTPLMYAIEISNDQAAEFLLWQGADPLIKNSLGKIASDVCNKDSLLYLKLKDFELLYATVKNDITTVQAVVETGALVNFQGHGGYSALMIAVEENLIDMVDYFLDLGADMTLKTHDGRDVFDLVTNPTIHSSLMKMKAFRAEILKRPEKTTFRFFMRPSSNNFTIN